MLEKQVLWIDWAFLGRSQNIAERLGVKYYHLNYFSGKPNKIYVILRYFLASIHTVCIILFKNPRIVITTGTPPFPQFIVYYLSKIKERKTVIDTHSGYFDDKKFHILPGLRKRILKNAFLHIVTNDYHKNIVESNNGNAIILGVLMESDNGITEHKFENEKNFFWIASYSPDEPMEIVFDVARKMPDVNFYITGNKKKAPRSFLEESSKYPNVVLTGFLPENDFISYMKGSTAVIALTNSDNTMQRGAYTALSYKVPIITSNWNLLKEIFCRGTVHIDNTSVGLENAIRTICTDLGRFRKEIVELNGIHQEIFFGKIREIREKLLCEVRERGTHPR